jgi:SpoVK/Ycf46/Vps4 family AAA+-type ATPase
LPAPLLRRFNLGTFFFDIPKTDEARMKILSIHRKKYKISAKDAAPDMHLWTGSDIENCCKRAYMLGESLQDASKNVVKVMVARREEMDNLRKSASNRYISASESGIYTYYDPYEKSVAATESVRRLKG